MQYLKNLGKQFKHIRKLNLKKANLTSFFFVKQHKIIKHFFDIFFCRKVSIFKKIYSQNGAQQALKTKIAGAELTFQCLKESFELSSCSIMSLLFRFSR